MGKTPIVFREPGVDPSLDEIPLRSVSARPLITCGVIFGIVALLACGGLMFASAQLGSKTTATAEPSPTLTNTPDDWAATGTAMAGWTPTFTPTATETPTNTPTPTMTLDAWDMTGTAVFWLTYTPTSTLTPSPTYTFTPRPTSDGPTGFGLWWANVRGTLEARREELNAYATVTAQAITPTSEPQAAEPEIRYVEVTRVVGGQAPAPEVRYVEVTPMGYQPPPVYQPTAYQPAPMPTVNPTYYAWLTWTATPTSTGTLQPTSTPTPSMTATHTPTASPTLPATATHTATMTLSATSTHTPYPNTDTPTATATATATATSTATDTPQAPPMATEDDRTVKIALRASQGV